MRRTGESPLLRFLREADLRLAAFLMSAAFLCAGIWVGQAFDLWDRYVEVGITFCLPRDACPSVEQPDPVSAELLTFGLLSLGGIAAAVFGVLTFLRRSPNS